MASDTIKYVNDATQGMLARLLAKENVTIQHGDFNTAFFDVKSRILGIPRWKIPQDAKDLYDLLVGHEVGHALYTPPDSLEIFKRRYPLIPFDVLNVVEDIRIENKIRNAYPGMISVFREGYKLFYEKQLFLNPKQDIAKLGMLDRLNAHTKVGHFIDVPMSDKELAIHDDCQKLETIDEVYSMCERIYKHLSDEVKNKEEEKPKEDEESKSGDDEEESKDQKQKDPKPKDKDDKDDKLKDRKPKPSREKPEEEKEKERQKKKKQESNSDEGDDSEDIDGSSSEGEGADNDNEGDESGDDQDGDEDGDCSGQDGKGEDGEGQDDSDGEGDGRGSPSNKPSKDGKEGDAPPSDGAPAGGAHNDFSNGCSMTENLEATTMKQMDAAMKDLQASPSGVGTFFAPQKKALRDQIIPWEVLAKERQPLVKNLSHIGVHEDWVKFKKLTMKHVSLLVKAFERKKSAWQYQRASESQTGSINVNKLYQYKYDDHIFQSVTTLADAKSHGMLFLIDYSGSMSDHLSAVLDQVLNLTMFCNQVKIPFEVYTFTSHGFSAPAEKIAATNSMTPCVANCRIVQILSSSMPKKALEEGFRFLRAQSNGMSNRSTGSCRINIPFATRYETMGGTPLMEAMMIFHEITKAFIDKFGVQKTIVNILTDGDGCGIYYGSNSKLADKHVKSEVNNNTRVGKFYGKDLVLGSAYSNGWTNDTSYAAITRHLRETFGVIAVGFYIDAGGCESNSKSITSRAIISGAQSTGNTAKQVSTQVHQLCSTFSKNHLVEIPEGFGFDKYFYVSSSGDHLKIKHDEGLNTKGNESNEKLAKMFTDSSTARRKSRVLLESFIDIIA